MIKYVKASTITQEDMGVVRDYLTQVMNNINHYMYQNKLPLIDKVVCDDCIDYVYNQIANMYRGRKVLEEQ